jgi:hypothetical protein
MRHKYSRFLPWLGLLLFITAGHFGGWWDDLLRPAAPQPSPSLLAPGIVIRDSHLVGWDEQERVWEIRAAKILQATDGSQIHFEGISEGVIFSVRDRRVEFRAGWVRWMKALNEMQIGGGMEARFDDGIFTVEEAVMRYRDDELSTSRPVLFRDKDLTIKANTMRLNLKDEILTLEGGVELQQGNDRVRAQGLIYNMKDETYQVIKPKEVRLNP